MTMKRKKRTVTEYIDKLLIMEAGKIRDVVRRQLSDLPAHINLSAIVVEVTKRGYKLLVSPQQMVIITDGSLTIFN